MFYTLIFPHHMCCFLGCTGSYKITSYVELPQQLLEDTLIGQWSAVCKLLANQIILNWIESFCSWTERSPENNTCVGAWNFLNICRIYFLTESFLSKNYCINMARRARGWGAHDPNLDILNLFYLLMYLLSLTPSNTWTMDNVNSWDITPKILT